MWFGVWRTRDKDAGVLEHHVKHCRAMKARCTNEMKYFFFVFLYVCRLSITIATLTSFSFFNFSKLPACRCVVSVLLDVRMRAQWKHQLPQHQRWAWKHRKHIHTHTDTWSSKPKKKDSRCSHAQKFSATSCSWIFVLLESFILRFRSFFGWKTGFLQFKITRNGILLCNFMKVEMKC